MNEDLNILISISATVVRGSTYGGRISISPRKWKTLHAHALHDSTDKGINIDAPQKSPYGQS